MYDFLASINESETFQHEEDSRCDVIASVDLVNSLWSDTKTGGATRVLTEIKDGNSINSKIMAICLTVNYFPLHRASTTVPPS